MWFALKKDEISIYRYSNTDILYAAFVMKSQLMEAQGIERNTHVLSLKFGGGGCYELGNAALLGLPDTVIQSDKPRWQPSLPCPPAIRNNWVVQLPALMFARLPLLPLTSAQRDKSCVLVMYFLPLLVVIKTSWLKVWLLIAALKVIFFLSLSRFAFRFYSSVKNAKCSAWNNAPHQDHNLSQNLAWAINWKQEFH